MRLALSIIGSTFRLPLIAAHFPKLARPFNETPLSVLSLFCGSRWIADFVDPPAGHVGGLCRGFPACVFCGARPCESKLDQAADGLGPGRKPNLVAAPFINGYELSARPSRTDLSTDAGGPRSTSGVFDTNN
jgi:hypothetical protein